jgi:hypothetical protein
VSEKGEAQVEGYLPAMTFPIDIAALVTLNANPVDESKMVLNMIPKDSPALTLQKLQRATMKYIGTLLWRFTAIVIKIANKRPDSISKGSSRVKYAKKKDSTE